MSRSHKDLQLEEQLSPYNRKTIIADFFPPVFHSSIGSHWPLCPFLAAFFDVMMLQPKQWISRFSDFFGMNELQITIGGINCVVLYPLPTQHLQIKKNHTPK
jgi:hypothetical protein